MRNYIIAIFCCPFFLSACGNNTAAKTRPPEYVFKTTNVDFGYSAWKENEQAAIKKANHRAGYYSRNACYAVGYGWAYMKLNNPGNMSCEDDPKSQRVRCRQQDVEVQCRRLKPGTVGMGMIPFVQ